LSFLARRRDRPSEVQFSAGRASGLLNVPAGSSLFDTTQYGTGELLYAQFSLGVLAHRPYLYPRILCDGSEAMPALYSMENWYNIYVELSKGGIFIGKWQDSPVNAYCLIVVLPLPFRNTLQLGYLNTDTVMHSGMVDYSYRRLR